MPQRLPETGGQERQIILTEQRWAHIIDGHPELANHRALVLSIATRPERSLPGRRPAEEWLYGRGGPSRWLKVVVHWRGDHGTVVTAFARRRYP